MSFTDVPTLGPVRPVLVLFIGLIACSDPAPVDPDPLAEGAPADAAGASATGPGASLDEILADRGDDGPFLRGLEPPSRTEVEAVENRHVPGQVDSVRTLVYPGLVIEAYEVAGGNTMIHRVAVQSVDVRTETGLGIGSTRSDVEAVFGAPTSTRGDVATYDVGGGPTPTQAEVRYEGDRAVSFVWQPYVD